MRHLTLAVDDDLAKDAAAVAAERNMTMDQLLRTLLENTVRDRDRRRAALTRLSSRMKTGVYRVGDRTWTREDLHER